MLETSQERVKLLKAGIDGKTIEKLYLLYNNFRIARIPVLIESTIIGSTSEHETIKKISFDVSKKYHIPFFDIKKSVKLT